jgi:hypothetical protein
VPLPIQKADISLKFKHENKHIFPNNVSIVVGRKPDLDLAENEYLSYKTNG